MPLDKSFIHWGNMGKPGPRKPSLAQECLLLAQVSGMSQASLARKLGLKPSNLNHYLKGHGDIRAETFVRLLKELNVDIEEILNRQLAKSAGIPMESKATTGDALEAIVRALG